MSTLVLNWSIRRDADVPVGDLERPPWDEVERLLREVWQNAGTVELEIDSESGVIEKSLQVQAEPGVAIIVLLEDSEDSGREGQVTRPFINPEARGSDVTILGNEWHITGVCRSLDRVIQIFDEFYRTRTVSDALLIL